MRVLRTPDEAFTQLPGYDYAPHYVEVGSGDGGRVRVHTVDEGDPAAPPVLLLHGEPSWSYLYRKMIPPLVEAGYRVVAPDLVGFGRSDKPVETAAHSYQRHVDWMAQLVEDLDLWGITLFGQDWGGLIGLRLATEFPQRFARIVAANTGLPTGDQPMPEAFHRWQALSQRIPEFDVGRVVQGGTVTDLAPEVVAAYNAPFPDESYKAGPRAMPLLVPTRADDPASAANRRAWQVLRTWQKPFLTLFSDSDPITRGADRLFQQLVPGAAGQPHATIEAAGHFLQEDQGAELAERVIAFVKGQD